MKITLLCLEKMIRNVQAGYFIYLQISLSNTDLRVHLEIWFGKRGI